MLSMEQPCSTPLALPIPVSLDQEPLQKFIGICVGSRFVLDSMLIEP